MTPADLLYREPWAINWLAAYHPPHTTCTLTTAKTTNPATTQFDTFIAARPRRPPTSEQAPDPHTNPH